MKNEELRGRGDEETGLTEWTYPVYGYGSAELKSLLSGDEWSYGSGM